MDKDPKRTARAERMKAKGSSPTRKVRADTSLAKKSRLALPPQPAADAEEVGLPARHNDSLLASKTKIANRRPAKDRKPTGGGSTRTPGSDNNTRKSAITTNENHRASVPGAFSSPSPFEQGISEEDYITRTANHNNVEAGSPATSRSPADEQLFEATLVDPDLEEMELEAERKRVREETINEIKSSVEVAEVVNESEQRRSRRRLITLLSLLTIASVIVASVMGVMLSKQESLTRREEVEDAVRREFGDETVETADRAIEWMAANDTTLEFPIEGDEESADFRQRFALCVLAFATDVDNWEGGRTNWIKPIDECEWTGLNCDDQNRLIGINLGLRGLNGTVPTEMGVLTDLRYLFFFDNPMLGGFIPSEMAYMESLTSFYAQRNTFSGTLPSEMGRLARLENLDLSSNQLNGPIPREFGRMHELTYLDLSENNLDGPIPTTFWRLQRLEQLKLNDNQLDSTIPTDVGIMVELQQLELQNNKLTGQLPTHLASLDQLQTLNVQGNDLTGAIPDGVCELRKEPPLQGLEILEVDCSELDCACCPRCSGQAEEPTGQRK